MKKVEILIRGANEEAVAQAMMVGIYKAISRNKCTDVSVQTETIKEGWVRAADDSPQLQIPEFLRGRR